MNKILILAVALIVPLFAIAEPQQNANLNDAEIVHVLVTANKIDMENGALAKKRTSNNDVLDFAARMVKEHAELMKQANELIAKLNLRSDDNAVSNSLETAAEQDLNKLKYFSDREFEKNYIDGEIKLHQKLIHLADTVLLPNVKNEELKAILVTVRPVLVSHLEHAQNIQKSFDIDERKEGPKPSI